MSFSAPVQSGTQDDFLNPTVHNAVDQDPNLIAYLRSQPLRSISVREPLSPAVPLGDNGLQRAGHADPAANSRLSGAGLGVTALIDAVLADDGANATMKRLAALAKAEMLSAALPSHATAAAAAPFPPSSLAQPPPSDALFSLSGDSPSPRLPVSSARRHSLVDGEAAGGNNSLMHPY